MKIVLQRVRRASVTVFESNQSGGRIAGEIGPGLVLLVGLKAGDIMESAARLAKKILELRIFEDKAGKMNRSVVEAKGQLLVISQFTLHGSTRKGRRPSFTGTMPPDEAEKMYSRFVQMLSDTGIKVATGVFGAKMEVEIINDGPVTFILEDDISQA
ncbi:MAG: D-tyrosyl-tRNA(Tyr) deacylase [FCB group bacterium]|nr:D-tyrosyl-tRNA(Tyr) deacylase [FCB group bacterium]